MYVRLFTGLSRLEGYVWLFKKVKIIDIIEKARRTTTLFRMSALESICVYSWICWANCSLTLSFPMPEGLVIGKRLWIDYLGSEMGIDE